LYEPAPGFGVCTVATVADLMKKLPVVVEDRLHGFALNRILCML
jgi:hypothetical protein